MKKVLPNAEFLETYPLYKPYKFNFVEIYVPNHLEKVKINMECDVCNSVRTFIMRNEFNHFYTDNYDKDLQGNILVLRLKYLCMSCESFYRYFLLKIDKKNGILMKVGQDPSFTLKANKEITKVLPKEMLIFYEKGLLSEYHGHGIAAFSYFRRVLEEIIGDLLELIPDLMSEELKEEKEFELALKEARKTHRAKEKIAFVKDLLPSILILDGGINPLQILYEELSAGMHDKNDEECLIQAEILKTTMNHFIKQLMVRKRDNEKLKANLNKILEERQKKNL